MKSVVSFMVSTALVGLIGRYIWMITFSPLENKNTNTNIESTLKQIFIKKVSSQIDANDDTAQPTSFTSTPQIQDQTSQHWERFDVEYDRNAFCLQLAHLKPKPFPKYGNPNIRWEWLAPLYMESRQHRPRYSIIYTGFDRTNILDIALLHTLIFARGQYELVLICDSMDEESMQYLTQLLQTWVYHYMHHPSYIDCTDSYRSVENDININVSFSKSDLFSKDPAIFHNTLRYYLKSFYDQHKLSDYFSQQNSLPYRYCHVNVKKTTKIDHESDEKIENAWKSRCGELLRIIVITHPGLCETSSNNLGMCAADKESKYYIHIQDDMLMTQYGFNIHWSVPLMLWPEWIWSVSGRQSHDIINDAARIAGGNVGKHPKNGEISKQLKQYMINIFNSNNTSSKHKFDSQSAVGRIGTSINFQVPGDMDTSIFHVRDMSIRGPLSFRADVVWKLGLFDEKNFHVGLDDLELHTRAVNPGQNTSRNFNHSMFTGHLPLQFAAKLAWGGTRRKRRQKSASEYNLTEEFHAWRKQRQDKRSTMANKYYFGVRHSQAITEELFRKVDTEHDLCYTSIQRRNLSQNSNQPLSLQATVMTLLPLNSSS